MGELMKKTNKKLKPKTEDHHTPYQAPEAPENPETEIQ